MERREFIRNSGVLAAGLAIGSIHPSTLPVKNPAPEWKGFNLLDFFQPEPTNNTRGRTTAEHLKWMRDWGFDFIRIPIAYPWYLDIDRTKNIAADDVYRVNNARLEEIFSLTELAQQYGLHVSLNLHRAPGYCINAGFHEPFNLWKDDAAQEAFYWHWALFAKQFSTTSNKKLSFDLLNEPAMRDDMNNQFSKSGPIPGELYRKVAKKAAETIRGYNKDHVVIADGNSVGNQVIPEITDLNIIQSCRGYVPGSISHYKAPWTTKEPDKAPVPKWPGQVGSQYISREMLEKYYAPWIALSKSGVGVHCGECGAWRMTPHDVFIAWFTDLTGILKANNIGYALWNFIGDFGILNSGRTDVDYQDWYGYKLDKKLLDLIRPA